MIIEPRDVNYGSARKGVDFAIIGSGSAGSVMAYNLAKAGHSVAVLEKGSYVPAEQTPQLELLMLCRILSPSTFQPATGKHTRVAILQGQCYGGSSVACDGVSWDLPRPVREDWAKLGLGTFAPGASRLDELLREIRKDLSITRIPPGHHNRNNQLLKIACEQSGLEVTPVERNVSFCMRCGFCAQGCKYGLKQDAKETYLKWANERKADVYTGCDVKKIHVNYEAEDDLVPARKLQAMGERDRATYREQLRRQKAERGPAKFRLECGIADRNRVLKRGEKEIEKPFTVLADHVIVSCGTGASSRLLLRSGLNPNGRVGKRFTLHPTAFFYALHPGLIIDSFDGINNSYECTQFAYENRDREYYDPEVHGFFLEASSSQPWGLANCLPAYGARHARLMQNYRRLQGVQLNVKSDNYGEVTEDGLRFDISERDNAALVYGSKLAVRLMLKVGAREVYMGLNEAVVKSKDDVDAAVDNEFRGKKIGYMNKQALLHTGHPFGGNIMGVDPETSVVDETCQSHHVKGLYVCDGSVFPTNIGVNPHLSITLVGRKTADHILKGSVHTGVNHSQAGEKKVHG
jgi:choline dehydrogenase-like flavoprotein